ncbi:MAG: mucoidy inhibitor MuiA family protein [Bacteroidetes bacterium]|nr:mucoidy inhibitor MuiA family protein [Bacteroidota bacterium]
MKKLITLLFSALCATFATANEITVDAKIESATVFLQGATLHNTASAEIPAGVSTITISRLSHAAVQQSLQVAGAGDFTILDVRFRVNYLTKQESSDRYQALEKQRKDLLAQQQRLNDEIAVYKMDEELLKKNMELSGKNQAVTMAELEKVANFYRSRMLDTKQKLQQKQAELEPIAEKLNDINRQLRDIPRNVPTGEVQVTVSSKKAQKAQFAVSYFMNDAGWTPLYDVRVEDVNKDLAITYKARVEQNSGISWSNIGVTLSTGNPSLSGTAPELQKWIVRQQNPQPVYKASYSKQRVAAVPHPNASFNKSEEVELMADDRMDYAPSAANWAGTTTTNNTTTIEFAISEKLTVASGGEGALLSINTHQIPAMYRYITVPKLDRDAFLQAKITNLEPFNFLSGMANIYFQGTYVGETFFNLQQPNDTIALSLGRDKNIQVERKAISTFNERSLLGQKRREAFAWEISVRNGKQTPITIQVIDQIPISGQSEIEISGVQHSGATLDKDSGKVTWDFSLDKGQTKKMELRYTITYPRNWVINRN